MLSFSAASLSQLKETSPFLWTTGQCTADQHSYNEILFYGF